MTTLFIADLHLCPSRPAIARLFSEFLAGPVRRAQSLYILGDLFDSWAGDDDRDDPFIAAIARALRNAAQAGVALFFMAGNRDFLLGDAFARDAGLQRLDDPARIDLASTATLLMHGDTLCTDDVAYQSFRREVRAAQWQADFLAQPLAQRKRQIESLRQQSEAHKQLKPMQIMDVNADAVLRALTFHRCGRLIHGHTHRPQRHILERAGEAPAERWVLPDWYDAGGYLECDASGCRLREWPATPLATTHPAG